MSDTVQILQRRRRNIYIYIENGGKNNNNNYGFKHRKDEKIKQENKQIRRTWREIILQSPKGIYI
jgi:hypothetical protein